MNADEQRWAVAEVCGVPKDIIETNRSGRGGTTDQLTWIPDYLNDLNATHEMEQLLWDGRTAARPGQTTPIEAHYVYLHWLWLITHRETDGLKFTEQQSELHIPGEPVGRFHSLLARATAAQRAEAFLKTLNLWKP